MNAKEIAKLLGLSIAAYGILVAANVTAETIYTNSKVGLDKKMLLKAGLAGVGLTVLLMIIYKK